MSRRKRRTPSVQMLTLPDGWHTADPIHFERKFEADIPGGMAVLSGGVLQDGSFIGALVWPTGRRFMRVAHYTGWAIEERFEGDMPEDSEGKRVVQEMWRAGVQGLVESSRDAKAKFEQFTGKRIW